MHVVQTMNILVRFEMYRWYNVFNTSIYFAEVIKIFK